MAVEAIVARLREMGAKDVDDSAPRHLVARRLGRMLTARKAAESGAPGTARTCLKRPKPDEPHGGSQERQQRSELDGSPDRSRPPSQVGSGRSNSPPHTPSMGTDASPMPAAAVSPVVCSRTEAAP